MTGSAVFTSLILVLLYISRRAVCVPAAQRAHLYERELVKRQVSQCQDGTYSHEGRTCCLCPAGYHMTEHCKTNMTNGMCEPCESGENFNSRPNSQKECQPCTSCSQPNANLEEEESCTPSSDAKCRCQKGHFCTSEPCILCQPCDTCDSTGVETECTPTTNTVCREKDDKSVNSGIIVGIVLAVLVIVGVSCAALILYLRNRKPKDSSGSSGSGPSEEGQEVPLVPEIDMRPHVYDITKILGWTDVKELAVRSGIPQGVIENVQLNHPNNADEQTVELFQKWLQKHGKNASRRLIKMLNESGKQLQASQISDLLREKSNDAERVTTPS